MPNGRPWRQPPNGFSLLLIILLAANYFAPFGDLDFAWQIRTAERIVETGEFRPLEAFTYTIASSQETEFEWLYEIVLWAIWKALGFGGLKLLKTILVVTPLLLLSLRLRREEVHWYGIVLAILTAIVVLSPAWNLRPLYCTTIGLLLVSGWLHDHCTGRRPLTCWLLPAMFLWSNLHPAVIVGQGLLAGAIGWEWLNRWLKWNPPLDRSANWRLTWIGGLGLAVTFFSPHPLDRLLFPFRPELAHPIQRIFVEMQPLYLFLFRPPYTAVLAYLVAVLVGLTVVLCFRHYRLWEVMLLLGLALLANMAVRSLQDWLLVMLALGVPHVGLLLKALQVRIRDGKRQQANLAFGSAGWWVAGDGWRAKHLLTSHPLRTTFRPPPSTLIALCVLHGLLRADRFCKRLLSSRLFRWQWFWPATVCALLTVVSLIPPLGRRMPVQESSDWPARAVDFIQAEGLEGRFFTVPDFGSYLTWRLGERTKCYVCSRSFSFPPELLEDSHLVPQLTPDWRLRMDRILDYGTDYFLLETWGPRGRLWHSLEAHIAEPLYRDDRTVLLSAAQMRAALNAMEDGTLGVAAR
jgi:hypothetical protein